MFEKAVLSIEDPLGYGVVHQAIESAFAPAGVADFLKSVQRGKWRVRHFESLLQAKLLGEVALTEYNRLGNSDRGQIREFYLANLEQVAPELRTKFFKLYAYY